MQKYVQRKRLAKKKWDTERIEESRQEYREMRHKVKVQVVKAKQRAYNDLFARLDGKNGEPDLYRLARQREREGKDVQEARVIKDRDGNVVTDAMSVTVRWKEYFEELMNEENERKHIREEVTVVDQEVEVWECLGKVQVGFMTRTFNKILQDERMPKEWRRSVLVLIFKNKGDVQSSGN